MEVNSHLSGEETFGLLGLKEGMLINLLDILQKNIGLHGHPMERELHLPARGMEVGTFI